MIVVLEKLGIEPATPGLQGILHHGGLWEKTEMF